MHINNHLSPAQFGHGSKPDHAAHASGKPQQFDIPTSETEPATTTDTATAVAPTEETEGPGKSGNSVAHRARVMSGLEGIGLEGLGGHNFGWLVSQLARGIPVELTGGTEGESADDIVAETDVTEVGETTAASDDTAEAGTVPETDVEGEDPVATLLDELTEETGDSSAPPDDEAIDPIVDLVDTLLDDNEDEPEVS